MNNSPKILAFSGSARKGSYNQKLVKIAVQGAEQAGAQVTLINLADFPMPIFNQDEESLHGLPETAKQFKRLLIDHDGLLIASPEYNSAFTPLLKNAIDWASRKENPQEPPLQAFKGKVATLMAATPGSLGGIRGLVFLRMLLGNIGIVVLPDQYALGNANNAFNEQDQLNEAEKQKIVIDLGADLAKFLQNQAKNSA